MEKKLQRSREDEMIAGVCSGLAEHFDIDVTWIRIAFVLAVMLGASGILAYIILWIVVPKKPISYNFNNSNADSQLNHQADYSNPTKPIKPKKKNNGNFRLFLGVIFVLLGSFFFLEELDLIPKWLEWDTFWPVILIAMGIYILTAGFYKKRVESDEPNDMNQPESQFMDNTDIENTGEDNSSTNESLEKPL
jgi:phage shock protein C